jgi:hypothetical protein
MSSALVLPATWRHAARDTHKHMLAGLCLWPGLAVAWRWARSRVRDARHTQTKTSAHVTSRIIQRSTASLAWPPNPRQAQHCRTNPSATCLLIKDSKASLRLLWNRLLFSKHVDTYCGPGTPGRHDAAGITAGRVAPRVSAVYTRTYMYCRSPGCSHTASVQPMHTTKSHNNNYKPKQTNLQVLVVQLQP